MPRLQLRAGGTRLRAAGLKTVLRLPLHLGLAARRIEKIRVADRPLLCLLPWEPEILQRGGIAASYVDHPLADAIDRAPAKQREQPWGCVPTTL